jgi:hypothetical protein
VIAANKAFSTSSIVALEITTFSPAATAVEDAGFSDVAPSSLDVADDDLDFFTFERRIRK